MLCCAHTPQKPQYSTPEEEPQKAQQKKLYHEQLYDVRWQHVSRVQPGKEPLQSHPTITVVRQKIDGEPDVQVDCSEWTRWWVCVALSWRAKAAPRSENTMLSSTRNLAFMCAAHASDTAATASKSSWPQIWRACRSSSSMSIDVSSSRLVA